MTTNSPNPVDCDVQALIERIGVALKHFTSGRASMHVPPLNTDVDIVLADCEKVLKSLTPPAQLLRPVELPPKSDVKMGGDAKTRALLTGMNMMLKSCTEALRQQGYEVKK